MALFLGIDASTQGIKAELIETSTSSAAGSFKVHFGSDLPQYKSPNGYIPNSDPLIKRSNPLMWLDALELLFKQMYDSGAPMAQIAGISGSGQQHGSVYLNKDFEPVLAKLSRSSSLSEQLRPTLSRKSAPIWMDRSTSEKCRELEQQFGKRIQIDTGSPPIERFTAAQIRKFFKTETDNYHSTAVIHLVSSFLCSVLTGKSAPIDFGDGAGMNLLNLKTFHWDEPIASFTAPGLLQKLPECVPSNSIAGELPEYFAQYGFTPGIPVAVWSGDNPSSLIGIGAGTPGVAGISLGTSDTLFAAMKTYQTDPDGCGHVFANPAGGFMSLICFS
ncbi:MAG: FGGY family carbohydrate kinase, partial [Victivallales bacterium]|nr:FGGY family carbohydrate kinase [Victivallales bacterium]